MYANLLRCAARLAIGVWFCCGLPAAMGQNEKFTSRAAEVEADREPADSQSQPAAAPPVRISIDEGGNLVIQSDDPAALDRLEEIMRNNRPPRRQYDVFEIEHTLASWVKLNLVEYFEDEDNSDDFGYRFFYFGRDDEEKDESRQLGDRPPMRFIADNDTNTIVVIGADDKDRRTIAELIELWDVPEPESDIDDARYTELVRVKYSRADVIANTLKDAYRDLLSANDKTFQKGDDGEEKRSGGGGGVGDDDSLSFAFKGKLSMGVDNVTNSILVSAEGQKLLDVIKKMINELDVAAQPQSNFEVYKLPPSMNNSSVKEALARLFATPKKENDKQQQQPNAEQAKQAQPQESPQGSSERGGRRSRR